MNDSFENVTNRKHHKVERDGNESFLDMTYQSLPETGKCHSDVNPEYQVELKEVIDNLTNKLEAANKEIDILNMENTLLKNSLTDCQNKLKIYKTVGIDNLGNTPQRMTTPRYRKIKPIHMQMGFPRSSPNQLTNNATKNIMFRTEDNDCIPYNKSPTKSSPSGDKNRQTETATVYKAENDVATICPLSDSNINKQRVHLFSDDEGRGMRPHLQRLLGEGFLVTSTLKPNATLDKIMADCKAITESFTKDDFVIIITRSSDKNPLKLQSFLFYNLHLLQHTNVIFGEVCESMFLNERSLNNLIKIVCNNFSHASFVNFTDTIVNKYNKLSKSRVLLREILKTCYHYKYSMYVKSPNHTRSDKSTQTLSDDMQREKAINGQNLTLSDTEINLFRSTC